MELNILKDIGLTTGESRTYLALTKLGKSNVGPVVKVTQMQRSTIYFCLESLIQKGLVSFIIENNIRYFKAENPEKLYQLIDNKMERLNNSKEEIERYIQTLKSQQNEEKEEARIFKGWNGMKTFIDDIPKVLKKNDDLYIMGVLTEPNVFPRFRRILGYMNNKRIKIGFRINIIMNEKLKDTLGKDREREPGSLVKYIPKDISTPAVTYVYRNKVVIGIWKNNPLAIMIENEQTAKSYKNYFNIIWDTIAKSRKEIEK